LGGGLAFSQVVILFMSLALSHTFSERVPDHPASGFFLSGELTWVFPQLVDLRHFIESSFSQYPLASRGLMRNLVLGIDYRNPSGALQSMRTLGLLHLFSVSGLHVYFAYQIAKFLANLLVNILAITFYSPIIWRVRNSRILFMMLPVLIVAIYVGVCGGRPPALRSLIVLIVAVLSRQVLGHSIPLLTVMLSLSIHSFMTPHLVTSLSFTMSWSAYLCVIGTATAGESLVGRLKTIVILQAKLLIVSTVLIGKFTPIAFAANVLFISFAPIVYSLALVAIVVKAESQIGQILSEIFFGVYRILEEICYFAKPINIEINSFINEKLAHTELVWGTAALLVGLNCLQNLAKRRCTVLKDT